MKLYSCCQHCLNDVHADDEWDAHEAPCSRAGCSEGKQITYVGGKSVPRDNDEHAGLKSP